MQTFVRAIAAGLRILTARLDASLDDLRQIHLAGAFGNYINRISAQRIGLLRVPAAAGTYLGRRQGSQRPLQGSEFRARGVGSGSFSNFRLESAADG